MNRTRLFVALLGVIFVAAIGIGVVVGKEDRPLRLAASDTTTTTTTEARTTTTKAPVTTTTKPAPTTTAAPPTTRRPVATIAPVVTLPPTTQPPVTEPPTTLPTTTTSLPYDPVKCADINTQFEKAGLTNDPTRIPLLQAYGCPAFYW